MALTQERLVRYLNDPAEQKRLLDEKDIEIIVDNSLDRSNPTITVRHIIRPEAIYLIVLMSKDEDAPPESCLVHGEELAEYSLDGALADGVDGYLANKLHIEGAENGKVLELEVYKLPDATSYRNGVTIHGGMFTPNPRT